MKVPSEGRLPDSLPNLNDSSFGVNKGLKQTQGPLGFVSAERNDAEDAGDHMEWSLSSPFITGRLWSYRKPKSGWVSQKNFFQGEWSSAQQVPMKGTRAEFSFKSILWKRSLFHWDHRSRQSSAEQEEAVNFSTDFLILKPLELEKETGGFSLIGNTKHPGASSSLMMRLGATTLKLW